MAERARLLVALTLGERVALEVDGLRRAFGSGQIDRIPPHLTLVPPTNVAAELVASVPDRLNRIVSAHLPFRLSIGPAATFPENRSVLFLAASTAPELVALRAELMAGAFGEPVKDPRPFVPHVTIDSRRSDFVDAGLLAALSGYRADVAVESVELFSQEEEVPGRPWSRSASFALGSSRLIGRGGLEVRLSGGVLTEPWPIAIATEWGMEDPDPERTRPEHYCLAEMDGRPVGLLTWSAGPTLTHVTRHVVAPALRGVGVGTKLLTHVEETERARGARSIQLLVASGSPAESYYHGRGYLPSGARVRTVLLTRRLAVGE